jgi:threonine dehydrogenase-like Zn-dependent dehydrogenase
MAAENAEIEPGETVAVWGCGPVAQMAIQSCWMLGAGRVIAIDRVPERLEMASTHGKAETINFDQEEMYDRLNALTEGRGPDRCIDAVGCEAHGTGGVDAVLDNVKATVKLATDRAHVIRQAGQMDPSFIITHRVPLEEAPTAYKTFRDKEDGCIKVVLKPS